MLNLLQKTEDSRNQVSRHAILLRESLYTGFLLKFASKRLCLHRYVPVMTLKRATNDLIRAIYNSHSQNTGGTGTTAIAPSTQHQDRNSNSNNANSISSVMKMISRSSEKLRASGIYKSMINFLQRELMSTTLATLLQTKYREETKVKLKLYDGGPCLNKGKLKWSVLNAWAVR